MTYVCPNCHKIRIALAMEEGKRTALEEQLKLIVENFGQAGGVRQAHGRADYWPAQIAEAKTIPDLSGAVSGMLADSGEQLKDKESWLNAVARFQESDPELSSWLAFAVWRAKILESVQAAPEPEPEKQPEKPEVLKPEAQPEPMPEFSDEEQWAAWRVEQLRKAGEDAVYTIKEVKPGVQVGVILRDDGTEETPPDNLRG